MSDIESPDVSDVIAAARDLMAASDRRDLTAFTSWFTPDADFHNPIGLILDGQAEIQDFHEKLYSPSPPAGFPTFADATSQGTATAARTITPDVAIVDYRWSQTGAATDRQDWQPRHGSNTTVWTRTDQGWRVVAWRDKDHPTGFTAPPGYSLG